MCAWGGVDRPFLGSASRLTQFELRRFQRLHRGVYVRPGACAAAILRAEAAWLWVGDNGVLAGLSAAALHGSRWVDGDRPANVIRRNRKLSVPGIEVHSDKLFAEEVVTIAGMRVTSAARTAFDLGRWLRCEDAVEMIDALCNATGLEVKEVLELAVRHPGVPGVRRLRAVLRLVDGGAESPAETRTRLVLVRAGLPMPRTQVHVFDGHGRFVARCDLGWERWRVVVEYDGADHWSTERGRTRDIRRYALLSRLGWRVVRVNSELLRACPDEVVAEVRLELRAAGADV